MSMAVLEKVMPRYALLRRHRARLIAQVGPQKFVDQNGPWLMLDRESTGWFPSQNRNRLFDVSACRSSLDEALDLAEGTFRSAGVERFFAFIDPCQNLDEVLHGLEARGYRFGHESSVLWSSLDSLPNASSRVKVMAATPDDEDAICQVLSEYGTRALVWPDISMAALQNTDAAVFLGWDEGRPIAIGLAFAHSGVAYLSSAATVTQYRGRGAHQALIAARLRWAKDIGCEDAVTETYGFLGESHRNLVRCGFTDLYVRRIFRFETNVDDSNEGGKEPARVP